MRFSKDQKEKIDTLYEKIEDALDLAIFLMGEAIMEEAKNKNAPPPPLRALIRPRMPRGGL